MALRLRFTPEDAERYGFEVVEFEHGKLRLQELRLLKNEVGLSEVAFRNLCQSGEDYHYALGVIAWLALLRAGNHVPFNEFEPDLDGIELPKDEATEDPNSSAPEGASES